VQGWPFNRTSNSGNHRNRRGANFDEISAYWWQRSASIWNGFEWRWGKISHNFLYYIQYSSFKRLYIVIIIIFRIVIAFMHAFNFYVLQFSIKNSKFYCRAGFNKTSKRAIYWFLLFQDQSTMELFFLLNAVVVVCTYYIHSVLVFLIGIWISCSLVLIFELAIFCPKMLYK
jgi:hypothetical protein